MNVHDRRKEQLGMPFGTANARLRKNILYKYIVNAGDHFCFKCGAEIISVDDLSIEHKLPWENRDTDLFWDLDNIAFSHMKCNRPEIYKAGGKIKHIPEDNNSAFCYDCDKYLPLEDFSKDKTRWNGLNMRCKKHENIEHKNRRLKCLPPKSASMI